MAIIEIREFAEAVWDGRSGVPAPIEPALAIHRLDNSGGEVVSPAFKAGTRFIMIHAAAQLVYSVANKGETPAVGDANRGTLYEGALPFAMGVPPEGSIAVQ